jgi:hypothetical protein
MELLMAELQFFSDDDYDNDNGNGNGNGNGNVWMPCATYC